MKTFVNWLSKPYYFNPSTKFKFKISLVFGLFVFIFLYIFKPFDLELYKEHLVEYLTGMASIIFLGSFLILTLFPLIFKDFFKEDDWTIGKNIFLIIIGIFIVGSLLRYSSVIYSTKIEMVDVSYGVYLLYTYLVSVLPIGFVLFINEKNVRERREKKAAEINIINKKKVVKKGQPLEENIVIYSENKKDFLRFNINNLVYVSSEGNYASFFIEQQNRLEEKILRITLTKIEHSFKKYTAIFRCHKSYIINASYISNVKGNARGYLLESNSIPFSVPVSRKFSKQSLKALIG